ncbi:GerMN domain-containing protein [Alkalicoccus urumqiensis]|uniref:GerMN domain-containing protein n=1 Tax=Alkalicoccus urumqiensis TaxID=1548213 RepID=A0A2P6MI03_ALKUR|nr:GerMN domain-containing protein [Alkalicoccus urumqiensis]PRO65912.1 hypothetical protein C6I21_06300 [Alkalicoccus urumqiensis]
MKRLTFVLAGTAALTTLAACGQGEETNGETTEINSSSNTETNEVNEPADEEPESDPEENETNETSGADANEEDPEENMNEEVTSPEEDEEETEEAETEEEASAANETNESAEEPETETAELNENESGEEEAAADEEAAMVDPLHLYYADAELLDTFKVEADTSVTMDDAGAMEAMELWAAGPEEEELYGLLPEGASVQSVELDDTMATVSLSPEAEDANLGSSGEMMLTDQIALMMEQFGAEETMILIDGEEVSDFLGHMDLSEPIQAGDPEAVELYSAE